MSDLAAQVTLSPSGLTRAVDRLEAAGLVAREACAEDRRSLYAVITPAGRARIEAAVPAHLAHLQALLDDVFSPEEQDRFADLLRKLRDRVSPCSVAGAGGTPPSEATPS
jgi:DNA-binding MarR family transcriptional regulator